LSITIREVIDWYNSGDVEMGFDFFDVRDVLIEYQLISPDMGSVYQLTDGVRTFEEILSGS
jgi:hypothetical protein